MPSLATKKALLQFCIAVGFLVAAVFLVQPEPVQAHQRTWDMLLRPLAVGQPVALGYVLGPARRGEEHDVVFTARAPDGASRIEVHVLDRGRWPGIRETKSFGVAYETPRSAARTQDCETVTEALAAAIRANDPGGLGPVDVIPLHPEADPPRISRMLDRISGARGMAVGVCLVGFTLILARTRGGLWGVSLWLAIVAMLLRAPSLTVPFVHDQDVQRLFTGSLSAGEILFGQGLKDRHPPLYFLVLHVAQLFGQSEAVVRVPAVFFGSLVGPAIVWAGWCLGRGVAPAALAGLACTVSVELIARSREVSSIPLFALLSIAMSVSLAKHTEKPSTGWTAAVAASHALALWTYYLAPFVIAGNVAILLGFRRLHRPSARALGIGILVGAPALALGVATFFRDRGARLTASIHPDLAWGEQGFLGALRRMGDLSMSAFGIGLLLFLVPVLLQAIRRRDVVVLAPSGALVASLLGIAALAPIARVQPYYLAAVLPLAALAMSLGVSRPSTARTWVAMGVMGAITALTVVPRLSSARSLYLDQEDAFMPRFAEIILDLPERRIVTVAHYDGTLLSYYLARRTGVPAGWAHMLPEGNEEAHLVQGTGKVIEPLARSHGLGSDPDQAALDRLERLVRREPVLVIERDEFRLQQLSDRLRNCTLLSEMGTGRLYRCRQGR